MVLNLGHWAKGTLHITGGTVIPITASTRINSLRRTAAAVASKNFFRLFIRLGEDVVPVIEVVELLRQLERMLGQRRPARWWRCTAR